MMEQTNSDRSWQLIFHLQIRQRLTADVIQVYSHSVAYAVALQPELVTERLRVLHA